MRAATASMQHAVPEQCAQHTVTQQTRKQRTLISVEEGVGSVAALVAIEDDRAIVEVLIQRGFQIPAVGLQLLDRCRVAARARAASAALVREAGVRALVFAAVPAALCTVGSYFCCSSWT